MFRKVILGLLLHCSGFLLAQQIVVGFVCSSGCGGWKAVTGLAEPLTAQAFARDGPGSPEGGSLAASSSHVSVPLPSAAWSPG